MLRTLLAQGPQGWTLLAAAQRAVLRAHLKVRTRPLGRLVVAQSMSLDAEGRSTGSPGRVPVAAPSLPGFGRAKAIEQAVSRVSRLGLTRPLCLVRSLAIHDLMERNDLPGSEVRVGVRMADGTLKAHAWVEWNGVVLGDTPESVQAFTAIRDLAVLPQSGVRFDHRLA